MHEFKKIIVKKLVKGKNTKITLENAKLEKVDHHIDIRQQISIKSSKEQELNEESP